MAPSDHKSLKEIAQEKNSTNPSQLGDPVSLKAETSNTQPTENDKPNDSNGKSMKQMAQEKLNKGNASQLGDPVSMKAETADSEPTGQDRGAKGAPLDQDQNKKDPPKFNAAGKPKSKM